LQSIDNIKNWDGDDDNDEQELCSLSQSINDLDYDNNIEDDDDPKKIIARFKQKREIIRNSLDLVNYVTTTREERLRFSEERSLHLPFYLYL
jgi:hypothetical protein